MIIFILSAAEPIFWSSNPDARVSIVAAFPRLYAWIVVVGDLVSHNRFPTQGAHRRSQALGMIHNTLVIMRSVGSIGVFFMDGHSVWNVVLAMWCRSRDCSLQEENWLAVNFNYAKDTFALGTANGFLRNFLYLMQEYRLDAHTITYVALLRVHRAMAEGAGAPEAGFAIHQHLLALCALVEDNDEEFPPDESPFHYAFFSQKGLPFILETMSYCAGTSRWTSVNVCIAIVAAYLRRTRSPFAFSVALWSKLIGRMMDMSCHVERLSPSGRVGLSFLLSTFLPEIMVLRSITELAEELETPDLETRENLARSEYSDEWSHLFQLRRYFFKAYKDLERLHGREYEQCGNVRYIFMVKQATRLTCAIVISRLAAQPIVAKGVIKGVLDVGWSSIVPSSARQKLGETAATEKDVQRYKKLKVCSRRLCTSQFTEISMT